LRSALMANDKLGLSPFSYSSAIRLSLKSNSSIG
jgi:hypothetical protein